MMRLGLRTVLSWLILIALLNGFPSANAISNASLSDRLPKLDSREREYLLQRIAKRLPRYRHLFVEASEHSPFSWTFLSALSYQESHWNPKAISPTGVRGIMMLTLATAQDLGVKDRLDPHQSIPAGATYLARLHSRLPSSIPAPDRLWLALAAYNLGYGHVLDAMSLAERQGLNPHRWLDIESVLPLLESPQIARTLTYGRARGSESVHFVKRVRQYWQVLRAAFENPEAEIQIADSREILTPLNPITHSARTDLIFTNSWIPKIPNSRP